MSKSACKSRACKRYPACEGGVYTRKASPVVAPSSVPFVIHIFVPEMVYPPPAPGWAFVRMARTSVPASGSDLTRKRNAEVKSERSREASIAVRGEGIES